MTELEKLEAGLEYCFDDIEVIAQKDRATLLCQQFNSLSVTNTTKREAKIRKILGSSGKNISIQSVFTCDNGKNIHVGDNFLANYNLTILDIAPVVIGDNVMIGPNVDIYAVSHPFIKEDRRKHLATGIGVKIGNDVWIGGRVTILPGVTIGDNVIVAAGSVVTKNIPSNSLVAGVPAIILKTLQQE